MLKESIQNWLNELLNTPENVINVKESKIDRAVKAIVPRQLRENSDGILWARANRKDWGLEGFYIVFALKKPCYDKEVFFLFEKVYINIFRHRKWFKWLPSGSDSGESLGSADAKNNLGHTHARNCPVIAIYNKHKVLDNLFDTSSATSEEASDDRVDAWGVSNLKNTSYKSGRSTREFLYSSPYPSEEYLRKHLA